MFFHVFLNGKTCDFRPRNKQVNYLSKVGRTVLTSRPLCNRIALLLGKNNFSSIFTKLPRPTQNIEKTVALWHKIAYLCIKD